MRGSAPAEDMLSGKSGRKQDELWLCKQSVASKPSAEGRQYRSDARSRSDASGCPGPFPSLPGLWREKCKLTLPSVLQQFNLVEVKPEMVGHYTGEFSISYQPVKHGRPGIGATMNSRFIPLKVGSRVSYFTSDFADHDVFRSKRGRRAAWDVPVLASLDITATGVAMSSVLRDRVQAASASA